MKQHITLKQWDELTHDQKNKLDKYGCKNDWRMTIGQMIWYIQDKTEKQLYCLTDEELCDRLWDRVKEVLNET